MSHRETEPTDGSEEQRYGKEQRDALILNRLVQELAQTNYTPSQLASLGKTPRKITIAPCNFQIDNQLLEKRGFLHSGDE